MPLRLLVWSPLAVAALVMLPRLLLARFGLLDDGIMLRLAAQFPRQWRALAHSAPETGRFFPGWAWFFGVVHWLTGPRPVLFFVVNLVVFVAITAALIGLVRLLGGTRLQAWAAGMFFVLSGASVESFYTLSKAEPPQLLWTMIWLLLAVRSASATTRPRSWALFAAATLALLAACATKETAVVMLAISLGWLVLAWLFRAPIDRLALAVRCLLMSALAVGAFAAVRAVMGAPPLVQGGYTKWYRLRWDGVVGSLGDWLLLLVRDYTYLIPLAVVVVVRWLVRRQPQPVLLIGSAVWMLGWMAVYLPWSWTFEYFLLPFSLGAAVFAGVAVGQIVQDLRRPTEGWPSYLSAVGFVVFVIVWPLNLMNSAASAAVQLTVDAANHDLLGYAATLPRGARLFVHVPPPSEYVLELGIHLADRERRPDIVLAALPPSADARVEPGAPAFIASPRMSNRPSRSVRMGFDEAGANTWNHALTSVLGESRHEAFLTRRHAHVVTINFHRPLCLALAKPDCGDALVRARPFRYGWNVYRVSEGAAEERSRSGEG